MSAPELRSVRRLRTMTDDPTPTQLRGNDAAGATPLTDDDIVRR